MVNLLINRMTCMYRDFDLASLEREYSPSSCIDDINLYIEQYRQLSLAAQVKAEAENALISNLAYGAHPDESLDLYLPTRGNNKKIQIYIHGGYWQALSKNESSFAANNFTRHGCYFAVINYSLAPDASLSEIINQVRKAISWLIRSAQRFGFDSNEVYLSGSSAGAHLAMMMLYGHWHDDIYRLTASAQSNQSNQVVKGICAVSGIYDLTPIAQTYINEALKLTASEIEENSPLFHQAVNKAPIIFACGEVETAEFKRQTQAMSKRLIAEHFQLSIEEIKRRNHFDVILDLADANSWLCQQVFTQMEITEHKLT